MQEGFWCNNLWFIIQRAISCHDGFSIMINHASDLTSTLKAHWDIAPSMWSFIQSAPASSSLLLSPEWRCTYLLIPHSPGYLLLKALDMILPLDSTCKKWHRNMHPHFLLTSTTGETQELEDGLIALSFNVLSTSSIVCRIARGTQYGCYLIGGASPTFTSCSKTSVTPISLVEFVKWLLQLKPDLPGVVACSPGSRRCCDSSPSVSTTTCSAGSMWCKAVSAGMPSESLVAPCGGYWRCSLSGLLAPPVSAMTPPLSSSLWVPSPGTTCIIRSGLYALILLVHLFLVTARCGILQVCQGKCCLRYPGGHTSTGTSGINATFIVSSLTSAESHFHAHTAFSTTPNSIFLDWWDWLWHMPLCTASSVLPPSATTMLE